MSPDQALNIADLRAMARRRLPRFLFDYIDRGAEDDVATSRNLAALREVRLVPRVLQDVSSRDTSVEVLGQRLAMPLVVAPTGSAGVMWYEGEQALARAAGAAGIPFVLAGGSTMAMERAVELLGSRAWFQLSLWQGLEPSLAVMKRARAAGIEVMMATVDTTVTPIREYNHRNGFAQPFRVNGRNLPDVLAHPRWLTGVILRYLLNGGLPRFQNLPQGERTSVTAAPARVVTGSTSTWEDFATLRRAWPGILVMKGVLAPADAVRAADYGADGVVVSNHGGRNLDAAPATIEMLPTIAEAVGDRLTVLFDGGVRRGSDVVKALALGARAVLAGRAPLYGVGAAGEAGAARALALLRGEMEVTLGFMGHRSVATLDRACAYLSTHMPS